MSGEEKKGGGGETASAGNPFVDVVFWFLFVLVVYATIKGIFSALGVSFAGLPSLVNIFSAIFNTVQVFSIFISLLFVVGIIYYRMKLDELMHHGHGHAHGHDNHAHGADAHGLHTAKTSQSDSHGHAPNKRWQNVQTRLHSHNESDWRLAIIESDILLNDMLGRMGYPGVTIAEKLKLVEKSDFNTIDEAWEAHKVRNRIAHDGAAFKLTSSEAERVVGLYQKVFEEFHFI
jgi:hypothetical protein